MTFDKSAANIQKKNMKNAITFSEKDAFYSKEITYFYKELNLAKPSH